MLKVIVVNKKKNFYINQYAQWISEEIQADMIEHSELTNQKLKKYDIVIFGGSLYDYKINHLDYISKHYQKLKEKVIIAFIVGITPILKNTIHDILYKYFSKEQQKVIKFYYIPGGFEPKKLTFSNKLKYLLLKIKIKKKKKRKVGLSAEEILIDNASNQTINYLKQDYIYKITDYIAYLQDCHSEKENEESKSNSESTIETKPEEAKTEESNSEEAKT